MDERAEKGTVDSERLLETAKAAAAFFVCDVRPSTLELIKDLSPAISSSDGTKVFSAAPRRVESAVPELRGRVYTLPPPVKLGGDEKPVLSAELTAPGKKVFAGTASPDPYFGISDPRVEACLNWVANSSREAAKGTKSLEPTPFRKTLHYDRLEDLTQRFTHSTFLTVVPRGGKLRTVMEDAPFDAVRNGFPKVEMSPAKALVIGAGGRGYDDSLSSSLRSVWGATAGLRKAGTLLLIAECSEGLGSTTLEMLATGRLPMEAARKQDRAAVGMEEVFYLNKLKDEYDVLLLSGLPEVYASQKLGLTTAKGSGEAVGRLLNKVGRSGKVNVVTRASECRPSA